MKMRKFVPVLKLVLIVVQAEETESSGDCPSLCVSREHVHRVFGTENLVWFL